MTESDFRINISRNINKILKAIYKNISNQGFDTILDLSDIPSTTLKDFWLYTTGFLGLKNQEELDSMRTDQEILDILSGNFRLIDLPLDQAQEFARRSKKKVPDKGQEITIDLYSIQDGTYSIKKGFKDENGTSYNCLALRTSPLEYHSDKKLADINITPREVLKTLRNIFAHRTPIKRGTKLVFERGEDEIIVTKMWLRGYSELFCRKSHTLNSSTFEQIINDEIQKSNNQISNKQELDKALSAVKHLFGENINQSFYKLSSFVQTRLTNQDEFYKMPVQNKVKILSAILANNYDYITTNQGTIDPSIIYNLQQLVGLELYARGELTDLSIEDYDIMKMKNLVNQVVSFNTKTNMAQTLFRTGKQFSKSAQQRYLKELGSMKSKVSSYLKTLSDKQKLESENMDLYNLEDLNYIPVEVAVNTVLLMSFNSLVTSSFYDDLILKTNTSNLNEKQAQFFDKFDFKNFEFYYDDYIRTEHTPNQKAYLLLCLREALVHGEVSYSLPAIKKGQQLNFKDTVICFKTTERQSTKIYGTVEDFYNLFSSQAFVSYRDKEIVTGKSKDITPEEAKLSAEDEENFKNLNEIVKELKEIDEEFSNL